MMNSNSPQPLPSIDRTKARIESWYRGRLNYKLRSYQKTIEDKHNQVIANKGMLDVYNCARRWGKTSWAIKKAIEVVRNPAIKKARVKYGSAFLTDLEEITIPLFQGHLEDCPHALKPKWISSKKKFVFPTLYGGKYTFDKPAEIKLVGLDKNPDGIRGGYADWILIEEAGYVSRLGYLYSSVLMPMTIKRDNALITMIGTPADTPSHDFHTMSQKAMLEDAYLEQDIYTNTYLTPEEIERIHQECLSESDWLREFMCQWVIDEQRAIIPEFNSTNIKKVERDENFKYYHKYEIMDLGVKRDKTVCLFGYRDFKRAKTVITHECTMTGPSMTTQKLADLIKITQTKAFDTHPVYLRKGDSDNPLLLQDLTAVFNLPFSATDKESLHAMVNQLRIHIDEYEIDPDCKETIGCLRTALWNHNRDKFDHSDVYGHFDALAALVYFERNVDKLTNPIPAKWNPNQIKPFKPILSPAAQGLQALTRKR